jgi:ABC-type Na+ transport system ATPase subunit NatA
MIKRILMFLLEPSKKPIIEDHPDLYTTIAEMQSKIDKLEEKYTCILEDIKCIEQENIETTNELYRLENSLDARIDIIAEHCKIDYHV